ncbi:MAG: hypothetical protein MUE51_03865 [Thermoleophilia bacterium]|nr:hypothetical protein [Thermoleophilia bacterium]
MTAGPRRAGGLVALAVAVLAAGCGGGGGSPSTAPPPPAPGAPADARTATAAAQSADEYREAANEICRRSRLETQALDPPGAPQEVEAFLRRGLAVTAGQVEALRMLRPPPPLAARHREAVAVVERQAAVIARVADRIGAGADPQTVIDAARPRVAALAAEADRLARALRLSECTAPGPATSP